MLPLFSQGPSSASGRQAAEPPFDLDDFDPEEDFDPPAAPPIRREELDDLVDRVLDEELERLRDLEEEMKLPPN